MVAFWTNVSSSMGFRVLLAATLAFATAVPGTVAAVEPASEPEGSVVAQAEPAAVTSKVALRLIVRRPNGQPAQHAEVGLLWYRQPEAEAASADAPPPDLLAAETPWLPEDTVSKTDADGVLELHLNAASFEHSPKDWHLFVRSADRQLAAVHVLHAHDRQKELELTLAPVTRVQFTLRCSALDGTPKAASPWSCLNVRLADEPTSQAIGGFTADSHTNFIDLPPGRYSVLAYRADTTETSIQVEVPTQGPVTPIELDLAPQPLFLLKGEPAPELAGIRHWQGGEPVRLEDLRGQVVLLDFWTTWCGPCIETTPALLELHDRFAPQGLVIISILCDGEDVPTEELGQRVRQIAQDHWDGRQLPFRLAMDGSLLGKEPAKDGQGATALAYAIHQFPTYVLIDREGKLVDLTHPMAPGAGTDISRLLDGSTTPGERAQTPAE